MYGTSKPVVLITSVKMNKNRMVWLNENENRRINTEF